MLNSQNNTKLKSNILSKKKYYFKKQQHCLGNDTDI